MDGDLGEWGMIALAGAALLFALAASLSAPALLGFLQKPRARRPRAPRRGFAFDAAPGRVDLSVVEAPEFAVALSHRGRACMSPGKRAIDLLAATSLIVFFAPVYVLVAALIRLDSPGPALYRQRRIGQGGAAFEIYKFRSMIIDAEKDGACWAQPGDGRVTRIGRVIRRLRIDELPQAFNVLKGEMSFVGPRPERPEFVMLLESEIPNYHLRHAVRPGITGWAQVNYEYGASVEDARIKLQYDLYYIRHFSLMRDLLIIAMTARVALFGLGSR